MALILIGSIAALLGQTSDASPIYSKGFVRQPRNAAVPVGVITDAMRGDAPDRKDWTETAGATSPVKNQGRCGSCWAFSATEGLESGIFMSTGSASVPLATQQVVACDTSDGGCNGGDLPTAFDFIIADGGLDSNAHYPDTSSKWGFSGSCNSHGHVATIDSYKYAIPACQGGRCNNQDESGLMAALNTHGPLSVCVNAETFNNYQGGIGIGTDGCSGAYNHLDHCVQLVGYDSTGSSPYWKVKNSWTTGWGEGGFIRLPMGSNYCGIADEAMYVTASLVSSDVTV